MLIVVVHPRLDRSVVNAALLEPVRRLADIEIHDLYDTYPDYQIDVEAEQARLLRHDVIGLQFPMFWYSTPSLLKEWFDLVWLHGFAYGRRVNRMAGKTLFCALSTGGDAHSYSDGGHNGFVIHDFLRPLERTAALCGMHWHEPFVVHDAARLQGLQLDRAAERYAIFLGDIRAETAR